MQVKTKKAVYVTVQEYRNGKRSPAKCRTIYGTTQAEFLKKLDSIGSKPEAATAQP